MSKSDQDIVDFVNDMKYGTQVFRVERVNGKTVKIVTTAEETLRYVDNDEARRDLDRMIISLIKSGFTGEAHVKLEMKNGKINLIGIFNKKETRY